ncbi:MULTISPECIES: hypothetical protein [unclassified Pseudoalteromonas]|uniref:hypothetical protein n=1 Tax=unclassified Pseudoalteromonas TaxID=194690 RepID=UPI0009789881|nr:MULTISPECIES: hypothetical protein [unclassified Pseudoalteromonas]MCK8095296.1 hypothetical protein [Pseudoalteromonas sp. 1CM17D]
MSYDEHDAAMDDFYDRMSEELYPDHKEQAIDEFIEERMQSYYLKHPHLIEAPIVSYHHANELLQISPRSALIMYTTAIELFLKVVLLKPVLYGMVHNESVAELIVGSTIGQSGFARYNKLLNALCSHAADIELSDIKGMNGKPILSEAEDVQKIRNKVVHQGYVCTVNEMGLAKNIASLILTEVVEPVLNNLNLVISTVDSRFCVIKA